MAADDGHDYRVECAKSGEPLITSCKPLDSPHPFPLEKSMAKVIIGETEHLSAYDVSHTYCNIPRVFDS